jgi:hypothetical protein
VLLHGAPDLAGVEGGQQHDGLPGEQARQRGHLRVAVDQRRRAELDELTRLQALARLRPLIGQRLAGDEVDAAAQGAPDVLVAPHHTLRVAGRPAGVDDVHVVAAARREVTLRRDGGQGGLVLRGVGARRRAAAVVDLDQGAQPGRGPLRRGDQRRQPPVVHQRGQVRVGEHVVQLVLDVAVVDVDRGGAELARRDQRLQCLDGVAGVEPDVISRPDPGAGQVVGQPAGPLIELAVGYLPVPAGHRGTVGEGVRGVLEEVGRSSGPWDESRTCYCSGQAFGRDRRDRDRRTRYR